jgi:radical SAM PhpK family P-methyltransferase
MGVDCFFVGNNCLDVKDTLLMLKLKSLSKDSIEYRIFSQNFVKYNNSYYTKRELFNRFFLEENNRSEKEAISMKNILNTTIAYLGSYISRRGFTFGYINEFSSQKEELKAALQAGDIGCVAVSSTYYTETHPLKEVIDFVKACNDQVKTVVGGPYIISLDELEEEEMQREFKEIGADFYVCSTEGEQALAQLLGALKENKPVDHINNLYYFDGGKYVFTQSVPEHNSFEDGIIDWSLFDQSKISVLNIRTSRSCPFACSFCTEKKVSGSYRQASIETVEAMLNEINKIDKKVSVMFVDDTFNIPPKRFKEFLRMMIKNKYKFKWFCFIRSQYLDDEMCVLMKESGCESVFVGAESGNQMVLDNMNKQVKLEDMRRGLELLNKHEIICTASFIVGFPGETYETYLDTIRLIEETKPTFYRANMWNCSPLSPIYKRKEEFGLEGRGSYWSHKTMDSETAFRLTSEMYLNVKNSIHVNDLDFDASIANYLLYKGLQLNQVKDFLNLYNSVVYEKIRTGANKNISHEIEMKMREACRVV